MLSSFCKANNAKIVQKLFLTYSHFVLANSSFCDIMPFPSPKFDR